MPHELTFLLVAGATLGAAVAAMALRNIVHCALAAIGAFAGLAALYLQLNAEFAGFAQILVYVGAVAILILFAVMLTHGSEASSSTRASGWAVAALLGLCLALGVGRSPSLWRDAKPAAGASARQIGGALVSEYIVPLETVGLLLTSALLGAVTIALRETETKTSDPGIHEERPPRASEMVSRS
ncbi:MAG TPA: NADH-quinone oxidoreductase subunit J [Verrucomicrobiae bacterium]|jgi:NADH-quinone oxidoreductase subunit J|nr:NADH-quinone oxidoreductase subunit J [Verrucomicrobiae bacterium]